jgi:hypothetical protein
MDAIEFVRRYEIYLSEIEQMVKPELMPVIEQLKEIDPHDLIRPDTYFMTENHARGFVWTLFMREAKK